MLVQVAFLRETQGAVELFGEGASEGPLPRVDAQVVVKVVEFLEVLATAVVVALDDLQAPLRLRVLVLDDAELTREGIHADRAAQRQLEEFPKVRSLDLAAVHDLDLLDVQWNFVPRRKET